MLRRCNTALRVAVHPAAPAAAASITKPDALREYHVLFPWRVAWGDMDAFKHVNNCVYLKYFEHSRVAYFEGMGLNFSPSHSPGSNPEDSISVIISNVSGKFRRPVTYPDDVLIGTRVRNINVARGDFNLEHVMWSQAQQTIVTTGVSGCVAFDYGRQKRSAIPPAWLERFRQLEGGALDLGSSGGVTSP